MKILSVAKELSEIKISDFMPKADGMECAADLTEEQHRPNQSALETVPSPRHEATSPPHVEADDMERDAARTHRPGQVIHAPAKAFAPPL